MIWKCLKNINFDTDLQVVYEENERMRFKLYS